MADAAARLRVEDEGAAEAGLPATDLTGPVARGDAPAPDAPLSIHAHDRQQIEVQLVHALGGAAIEPLSLELFFFIPRNVGVTAANYPRDEFYGDLTTFLRLDLPDVTLEELAGGRGGALFGSLPSHIDAIGRGDNLDQPVSVEVKLFGHAFTEAVRERFGALLATLHRLPDEPLARRWDYLDEVDRFGETARAALVALRRAARRFAPLGRAAPTVEQVFQYTDEYSSLFLDGALALLAQAAQEEAALFDGSGFVGRLRQTLARHARLEAEYRAAVGYLNLGDGAGSPEYFTYRQSFLKKAVQQALYVDTRRLPTDTFVRNTVSAVAAGLAATWALVARFPARVQNLSPIAQSALIGLPIVAYMAKDRIKELTREWLLRRVRHFDNSSEIRLGSLADAGLGHLSGRVQERLSFLELDGVPPDVMAIRVANRTVRGAEVGGEGVLLYKRRVELAAEKDAPLPSGMALRQILRLNMRHFLTRLDEPRTHECHYATGEERFVTVELPKVYHINLIARLVAGDRPPVRQRWRIVLNKKRVVRLETVATRVR